MELGEVRRVRALVSENTIYTKQFRRLESSWLICYLPKKVRRCGGRMSP